VAELAIESSKESIIKEIENREPQIRDVLIAYFRSHTAQEISDISFQEKSRSEIIQIVNDRLNSGVIDSVYYVKLILQ
jgi:flagellar basal body-associated protein FliL